MAVLGATASAAIGVSGASAAPTTWNIDPSPGVAGETLLYGVSCPTTTFCVATGTDAGGPEQTLIEMWNGTSWSVVPSPVSPNGYLNGGVSCTSPTFCVAVGNDGITGPLIEMWDGTSWSVASTPNPGTNTFLHSASCTSPTFCVAVGYTNDDPYITVVEMWNGTAWSVAASPNPGAVENILFGVSCVSATNCTAVGDQASAYSRTLIEGWDGTSWRVVPSPNTPTVQNFLSGVSCVSATSCNAVGYSNPYPSTGDATLVETWDGTTWSIVPSPSPGTSENHLFGVSCVSTTDCVAVGSYLSGTYWQTLVETWDGLIWSTTLSPSPANSDNFLYGVSCTASCKIAGYSYNYQQPGYQSLILSGSEPAAPDAPSTPSALPGDSSATVSFTPPTSDGGSPVQHFDATCTSSNLGATTGSASGTASPLAVSGLTNGDTYTCVVTATNAIGTSTASAPSNTFIPQSASIAPSPPTIGSVASAGVGAVSVSFTPGADGGSPITGFAATCTSLAGHDSNTASGAGSPIIVTGLVGGTPYSCSVTATNVIGTSDPSGASSVIFPDSPPNGGGGGGGNCTTIPTAPRKPSTAPGNGSATVSWAPSLSGCVAGYIVTPYLHGTAQTPTLIPGPGTTTVITGLINGDTYTFTVTAENGKVTGPPSVMTSTAKVGVPGVVTGVTVTKVGKGTVRVTFAAAPTNGAAITSYTATCTSSNGGKSKSKVGRASPLVVSGLTVGKNYWCSVTATNRRGAGPSSRQSAAIKA